MSTSDPPVPPDPLAGFDGDESIPLLTEVVEIPRYGGAELPASLADVDWAALSQQVQDNVFERLMQRSTQLFDTQVRAAITPVLDRAARQLSADLESAVTQLTRELVEHAIADELARVHAEIAARDATAPAPVDERPR